MLDDALVHMYEATPEHLAQSKAFAVRLVDRAVAAVEKAFASLKPAKVDAGDGVTRFAVNRRNNRESKIVQTHDIAGPSDHAVPVIRVADDDGEVIALVFGYACHCTVLAEYKWCGDYAGFAQIAVEEAHPGCTAMFFAGCGADQNAFPRRSMSYARQYGNELAAAVQGVLDRPMRSLEPTLTTVNDEPMLDFAGAAVAGDARFDDGKREGLPATLCQGNARSA